MFSEDLRNREEILLSGKYDLLKVTKKDQQIVIKKTKTGKTGWIYFISFFTLAVIISFFSHQWLVYLLAFGIALSTGGVIFLNYQTTIDLNLKQIILLKKLLFINLTQKIPFEKILDFKIKDGEIGYNLKLQLGENTGFIYRIKAEWVLCRVSKYEESVELLNWIREIIKPK